MIFRKGGSRKTMLNLRWKNEEIEELLKPKYLEYILKENPGFYGSDDIPVVPVLRYLPLMCSV